jgi:hypothetical protein
VASEGMPSLVVVGKHSLDGIEKGARMFINNGYAYQASFEHYHRHALN